MSASPSSPSRSSQLRQSQPGALYDRDDRSQNEQDANASPGLSSVGAAAGDVPVEVLVEHLLAAKRSLSSITLVLRANDLTTQARQLHEEAVIHSSQAAFLRRSIGEQVRLLLAVRRGMGRAYDAGRREFRQLVQMLDAADARLETTMAVLRGTVVESVFRPDGEEPKTLLDFVDENSVDGMRNTLKESLAELQAAQTSFDGDLLRFDNDLRALNKTLQSTFDSPPPASPSSSSNPLPSIPHLLASLAERSHAMAEHLTSLTRHFDMCVTAVRSTEGGAALALRKAAEVTQSQGATGSEDVVSISGVIAEPEPLSAPERAEVAAVVVQDAPEVDEVVSELTATLAQMEADFGQLREQASRPALASAAAVAAFRILEEVGTRLPGYAAAEAEYVARREAEREAVAAQLEEMEELRSFYEGYLGAYDGLILEAERRRAVEDKIRATWRKARDGVERLVEADRREREIFRQEIGEFLPTDLWMGMGKSLQQWEVVPIAVSSQTSKAPAHDKLTGESIGPAIDRSIIEAAKGRLGSSERPQ